MLLIETILNFLMYGGRRLKVEADDSAQCIVRGNRLRVIVNRAQRLIEAGHVRYAADAVDATLVRRRGATEYERGRPHWEVALRLRAGGLIEVGSSNDDVNASIAAAALGRSIGCAVQQV